MVTGLCLLAGSRYRRQVLESAGFLTRNRRSQVFRAGRRGQPNDFSWRHKGETAVSAKRPEHTDSISVFLQGVRRADPGQSERAGARRDPAKILESLDSANRSLKIDELHNEVAELSLTRLTQVVDELADAGLVDLDRDHDDIRLTDVGRSVAKLKHIITSSEF